MAPTKRTGKKVAPAPSVARSKTTGQTKKNPLFVANPRIFSVGNAIQPKRDLTRFVKMPAYVRLQRQRRVLKLRLKVPPAVNQFTKVLDKNTATNLFRLFNKYRPETRLEKRTRLRTAAAAKAEGKDLPKSPKPYSVKMGINHVTALIEAKKAQLVVIADDVEPLELVIWLPALCRKMGIPYCIVKGKARLGTVVHKKTATVLAFTEVREEDKNQLATLVSSIKANFNDKFDEHRRNWGGNTMSQRSQDAKAKRQRELASSIAIHV
ncbi:50S ribosomal protein L30e-like protein [Dimargaris cristalligena]|uniref:60S ribosomal protein L8 n=1 Tax=Dimargaris cristalligena TaxID=215637 RepID=A0A4P9ZX45_9FUNG|nr:50S ribosomal protein L30e-like protein [Dimargaris cristalligena]|eukprot:RKP38207.1 50S ribosomal protein L30e-like protein [Dimargaris cristalligena]